MIGHVCSEEHIVLRDIAAQERRAVPAEEKAEGRKHTRVVAEEAVRLAVYVAINVGDQKHIALLEDELFFSCRRGAQRIQLRILGDGRLRRLRHQTQTALMPAAVARSRLNADPPTSRAYTSRYRLAIAAAE